MLLIASLAFFILAAGGEGPRPACAPLLWPASTSLKSAVNYPLRDGRLDPRSMTTWPTGGWDPNEFEAWSSLAATTTRSAVRAREAVLRLARGKHVAGLSAEAHRRVRAAYVIHQDVAQIEAAAYLDGLIVAGFLPDRTPREVRQFTGTFGPRFTPEENSKLSDVVRALALSQAYLGASRGEASTMRDLMLGESRSLNIPFDGAGSRTTLSGEDAIYLIRSLPRENLLRHSFLKVSDDVRFLLSFHPELHAVWPQLGAWSIRAHEIELHLADSYLNAPNVRLTPEDSVGLQVQRHPFEIDGPPFTESVAVSLVVSRRDPYDDEAIHEVITRLHGIFERLKSRIGSTHATLKDPLINTFEDFFVLSWPQEQLQPAALITFYAYLRELFPPADP